jgi:hypothetical protein
MSAEPAPDDETILADARFSPAERRREPATARQS